ncbi:MAG TPA: hypothetical protein VFI44_07575 [Ornithinibacter sp.]|nr:hypothetical protein [Ornithinibacter sp.]
MTDDLRVTVGAVPEPGLLRPAIEAALAGRPWPPGPEATVAAAVAAAVSVPAAAAVGDSDAAPSRGPEAPGIRPRGTTHHGGEAR